MPSVGEKQRRKELAQRAKALAAVSVQASFPITAKELKALFNYLDEKLTEEDCDDTLCFTKQFATDVQLPYENLKAWLATLGGYCDCEVLSNVEEKIAGLL